MVKHVIIWTLNNDYGEEQKNAVKENIKAKLEALGGIIDGIVDIKVYTDGLPSANADLMLDSTFKDAQALKAYATHPAHVKVAQNDVVPHVSVRSCFDFEI